MKPENMRIEVLEEDGACARCGLTVDSALLSVAGVPVATNQHQLAMAALKSASKIGDGLSAAFEVIVRAPKASRERRPIVQSL